LLKDDELMQQRLNALMT